MRGESTVHLVIRAPRVQGRPVRLLAPAAGTPNVGGAMLFRILVGVDALAALVILYFFVAGLGDGSVSAENGLLWLALIACPIAVIGAAFLLEAHGRRGSANLLLAVLAAPALLALLLLLLTIVVRPDFR